MMKFKKIGLLVGALLLAGGINAAANAAGANLKVAVVNVQAVMQQSPRVATLSKQLEDTFKARQAGITGEEKTLQGELEKFKTDSATMTAQQKSDAQKKLASERADLVKKVIAYQQDLQKAQTSAMQGILTDLNGIVSSIAKAKSYDLVLDSQVVVYAMDGTDITKDVSQQFNAAKQ